MGEANDFYYAVLGGFLVSLGATFHIYFRSRTTGFNAMAYSVVTCDRPSMIWKGTMIVAIMFTSCILWNIYGFSAVNSSTSAFFDSPSTMVNGLDFGGFALAGFLVGFGARLSHGCTSGHLICGIPRRSARSLVAVVVYMGTAFLFAMIRNEDSFLDDTQTAWVGDTNYSSLIYILTGITGMFLIVVPVYYKFGKHMDDMFNTLCVSIVVGVLFAWGMIYGGMNRRSKVNSFLNFTDESLLVFYLTAIVFNLIFFYCLKEKGNIPINEIPSSRITWRLIFGSVVFGIGWALGGLCPGPSFVLLIFMTPHITFIWLACLILGQFAVIAFEKCIYRLDSEGDYLLNYE